MKYRDGITAKAGLLIDSRSKVFPHFGYRVIKPGEGMKKDWLVPQSEYEDLMQVLLAEFNGAK